MFAFILTNQWKEYTSVSEINDSDIFPSNSNILPKKDFTHKLEGLSMLCFFWNVFGSLIPLIPTKLTQRGRQEYGAGITNIASPQNEVIRLCLCRTGPVLPPNLGWISFQTVLEWSHWLQADQAFLPQRPKTPFLQTYYDTTQTNSLAVNSNSHRSYVP